MSDNDSISPHIDHIAWGSMKVARLGDSKDFKLWPGGGRAWDWRETGTQHSPGIQAADVEELLQHGSEVIVLSRGMLLRLGTAAETIELLESRHIPVHIAETRNAVRIYNDLVKQGKAVGGLFHSTC